ncbi:succinylglutamate desuccinylase/aspartoacylase family protein [Zavarzinia compransoris]|uniref:succinylglutamate desuccinylase/aspartoacylase family protein n=1 Tax=Zavarzinia marina TaxID=2911065 RepID=UPI001F3D8926|nr:succinylglutamate desuccinylase/aspartoacylase family protein [Zavarzinia marina]MCF4167312.1 succinylglutamate desuccinylase/aspartoacylase family protein [Zavarzinia marina]
MMISFGPVHTTLDFSAAGINAGNLYLDHSDDRHAASLIPVPVIVLRRGEGPTVLLTAGIHGDEYEGQIALRRLVHDLPLAELTGRIILLPAFNAPAVRAARRVSPLDGVNLNRAFPGAPDRGPTAAIAGFVMEHLVPMADFVLDLHSGGTTGLYADQAFLSLPAEPRLRAKGIEAAAWLGAPLTVTIPLEPDFGDFDGAVLAHGVPFLSSEFGGGALVSPGSLARAVAGVRRVLHWTGVWRGDCAAPGTRYVVPAPGGRLLAPRAGLFEPAFDVGQEVAADQIAGRLHDVDEPLRPPLDLRFGAAGVVVNRYRAALVPAGAILATVAGTVAPETL